MDTLPRILTFAFLITATFSVGLQTTAGDLCSLLGSKGFLVRTLGEFRCRAHRRHCAGQDVAVKAGGGTSVDRSDVSAIGVLGYEGIDV
jgi:hypothetical protein